MRIRGEEAPAAREKRDNNCNMPWFEDRRLFVGDTQIRRYEPGVREGRVDVDSDADAEPDGSLSLEAGRDRVVHSDCLIRQHFTSTTRIPHRTTQHVAQTAVEARDELCAMCRHFF